MVYRKLKSKRTENTDCLTGRLYTVRLEHDLTCAAVADKSKITNASYSCYEAGLQKEMAASILFRLARTLKCNLVWLWTGEGHREMYYG